ncbi:MAG: helix-turn-helix transcriptional regulator, partial [Thermomicrobiales bacterium]
VLRHHDAPDAQVIAALRRALAAYEWLAIIYANASGTTERTILPLRIYTSAGRWYVDVADSLREEWRMFRISRISSTLRVLEPKTAASTLRKVAASGKNYHHQDNPLIQVHLTERGVELAADHPDFRNHLSGNTIEFRCPASEIPYYGIELVRFGTAATITSPPELLSWIRTHLDELRHHHTTDSRKREN